MFHKMKIFLPKSKKLFHVLSIQFCHRFYKFMNVARKFLFQNFMQNAMDLNAMGAVFVSYKEKWRVDKF